MLYAMAAGEAGKQFFIARPRRFGKSLAVSTLKSLFQGEREWFADLAIEPKWDWSKKWPVLHLDMGSAQTTTVGRLSATMLRSSLQLGLRIISGPSPGQRAEPGKKVPTGFPARSGTRTLLRPFAT